MAWWNQPLPPEEEKPVGFTDIQDDRLSEEDKRKAWRLLALLDALRDRRPQEPASLDEVDLLGKVAKGQHDLHDACAALRAGCGLDLLVQIFT